MLGGLYPWRQGPRPTAESRPSHGLNKTVSWVSERNRGLDSRLYQLKSAHSDFVYTSNHNACLVPVPRAVAPAEVMDPRAVT